MSTLKLILPLIILLFIALVFASQSSPVRGPYQSAADQAQSISSLLTDAKVSRSAVLSAVADVARCRDLPGAISTLSRVAADRQSELSRADQLNIDQLPNGMRLQDTLKRAFSASLLADRHFLAWAQSVADCSGSAPLTSDYRAAAQVSQEATAAKQNFVSVWNLTAEAYQLPIVGAQDI